MCARRPPPQEASDEFKDAVKAAVRRGALAIDLAEDEEVVKATVGQHVLRMPNICEGGLQKVWVGDTRGAG